MAHTRRLIALMMTLSSAYLISSLLSEQPVIAAETSTDAAKRFDLQGAIQLALLVKSRTVEQRLKVETAAYHEMSTEQVDQLSDLRALRAQVIAAQENARTTRLIVAEAMTPAQVQSSAFGANVTSGLAAAAAAENLSTPFTYSVGGTRVFTLYDATADGTAPAVSPTVSRACDIMSYVTGAFGTAGPQFISSSGQTIGQKNVLSIVGFAIGVVPVALNCTKDHKTTPDAGKPQQRP